MPFRGEALHAPECLQGDRRHDPQRQPDDPAEGEEAHHDHHHAQRQDRRQRGERRPPGRVAVGIDEPDRIDQATGEDRHQDI